MTIEFAGLTDVGHKRDHNEDSFVSDGELGLFVLCDGMGGHAAGEVASEISVNAVHAVIEAHRDQLVAFREDDNPATRDAILVLIEGAVQKACKRVWDEAQADATKAGMGTTLEMVLVVGHTGFMGHVGDSRLYMKRDGEVHQLSEDHSFVREMVRAGKFTDEEARKSPMANVITRAVGIQETVKVDTLVFDILPGDTLLLCSDGLSDYLEGETELGDLLAEEPLESTAQHLIDLANERGGKDNITTVLIRGLPDDREERQDRVRELGVQLGTLKRVRLFKHLTFKELMMLLNLAEVERHEAGVALISEGKLEDGLFVVLDGSVTVSRQGKGLAELGPGDHFGEMELITTRERSATVTTSEPASVLRIRRETLFALLKANEQLAVKLLWSFLQTMSVRLYESNAQLSETKNETDGALPF